MPEVKVTEQSLNKIYDKALEYVGTKEVKGPEHNPTIVGWLKRFARNIGSWGRSRDETPWCAVFVSMVLAECGLGLRGTEDARAYSYVKWGKPSKIEKGAVVVIRRKRGGADARTGSRDGYHVGFLNRITKNYVVILGGNQSNSVRISYFPRAGYDIIALRRPYEV